METPHLYYYYKKGLQPFRTVMDFPEAELTAFMETYLPEEDIFHKDPSKYITKRRETELWLHTSFRQKGGRPASSKPIYMTLGKSPYIERLGVYTECLEVPISLLTPETLSFTYTDSYVSRWLAEIAHECFNPSLHGKVFTFSEMLRLLSDPTCFSGQYSGHGRYDFFVEAQVWDHAPLQRLAWAEIQKTVD
jgi:hypothetical protein